MATKSTKMLVAKSTKMPVAKSSKRPVAKPSKIPVVVCEFHQEVLQFIHRLIARKKLPFNSMKMIHLDSHPDLSYPDRLSADDCYCKEKMYYDLDIADWILPLMYAGHIDHLFWVKPPWADQIIEKRMEFDVGKDKESANLRVTCTEDYFLEDCTFAPSSKLTNIQHVTVESIELQSFISKVKLEKQSISPLQPVLPCNDEAVVDGDSTHTDIHVQTDQTNPRINAKTDSSGVDIKGGKDISHTDIQTGEPAPCIGSKRVDLTQSKNVNGNNGSGNNSNGSQNEAKRICFTPSEVEITAESADTCSLLSSERYILDIDLDFFSVTNPFLQDYSESQYNQLREVYSQSFPACRDDDVLLDDCVSKARTRLDELKKTIDSFHTQTQTQTHFNETKENATFFKLLQSIKEQKNEVDWEMVHNAGMTTELPHHISSEDEIDHLIDDMVTLLKLLPVPAAITVARSTVDEYCPPHQIDMIQEKVVCALQQVYSTERLDINYDYNDESRLI